MKHKQESNLDKRTNNFSKKIEKKIVLSKYSGYPTITSFENKFKYDEKKFIKIDGYPVMQKFDKKFNRDEYKIECLKKNINPVKNFISKSIANLSNKNCDEHEVKTSQNVSEQGSGSVRELKSKGCNKEKISKKRIIKNLDNLKKIVEKTGTICEKSEKLVKRFCTKQQTKLKSPTDLKSPKSLEKFNKTDKKNTDIKNLDIKNFTPKSVKNKVKSKNVVDDVKTAVDVKLKETFVRNKKFTKNEKDFTAKESKNFTKLHDNSKKILSKNKIKYSEKDKDYIPFNVIVKVSDDRTELSKSDYLKSQYKDLNLTDAIESPWGLGTIGECHENESDV